MEEKTIQQIWCTKCRMKLGLHQWSALQQTVKRARMVFPKGGGKTCWNCKQKRFCYVIYEWSK